MLNHILLKLIWSRFTTAQIHLLLKTYPSCCEVDEYERMHILENFCKLLADKKIDAKVNRYKKFLLMKLKQQFRKPN